MATIGQFISQPTDFVLGHLRFQRDYLWDVLLPDIGFNIGGLGGLFVGQLVQSIQFGDYSMETPSTMRVGPYTASFAGMLTVDRVQISFLKTMPDAISAYFNAWKNLIVDKSGLFHPKNDYQKNIYIRFIDSTGIAFGRYKLIGAFPITFPKYSNLNYESNTVTKVNIEFRVDKIEYEWF